MSETATLPSPRAVRSTLDRLTERRASLEQRLATQEALLAELQAYLARAPQVTAMLEHLSNKLFGELNSTIETQLTAALQEVLEQPIEFKSEVGWSRDRAALNFTIERGGQQEDIMYGQGGSVINILSVGLRMLALMTMDPRRHRRFLVLDEQDCWLRPDLVPRLVRIVRDAGRQLGFQILMISHHNVETFSRYADKIIVCEPCAEGIQTRQWAQCDSADDPAN